MDKTIRILLDKSIASQYCGVCRFLCGTDGILCSLTYTQLVEDQNGWLRTSDCIDSQINIDNERFIKHTIDDEGNYESCGDCMLQYAGYLENGFRYCKAFKQKIEFEEGVVPQGDDVYELHYRCKKCLKSEVY